MARTPELDDSPNAWGMAASVFAATMLIVVGIFQFFEGLIALVNGDEFLVRTPDYILQFDATTWGWIHIVLAVVAVAVGLLIFGGNIVARAVGILIAALSALANFLWLPYYPIWSLILIALNVFVIWGLSVTNLSDE